MKERTYEEDLFKLYVLNSRTTDPQMILENLEKEISIFNILKLTKQGFRDEDSEIINKLSNGIKIKYPPDDFPEYYL